MDTKIEKGNKHTVFTEPPEQLPSSETEGETTVLEEETGDEMIDCFELIEQRPPESQRETFFKKSRMKYLKMRNGGLGTRWENTWILS